MALFHVDDLHRLPSAKIFGALAVGVLLEASFGVGGDAGIEGVVGAEDDIDLPVLGERKAHGIGLSRSISIGSIELAHPQALRQGEGRAVNP